MTRKRQRQKEAEAGHAEPERMGMGTVLVAIFMFSSLTMLADSLWPFLPKGIEKIVGAFIGFVAVFGFAAGLALSITDLSTQAGHSGSERMGMGTVFAAIFMLSCLTLLAETLWPFLPEWGTCILGTFVMIVASCGLLVNKIMAFIGMFRSR